MTTMQCSSLDILRAYTAQFGVELGPDDKFLPHEPISADAAAELVRKWKTGSMLEQQDTDDPAWRIVQRLADAAHMEIAADGGTDWSWDMLQMMADDYEVPLDEFLGAIWFVSQHNGAYKKQARVQDQVGCAIGEIIRVLQAFHELTKVRPHDA